MPTVLIVKGYRFFFFSNELREPPHIHVEKGEKYAKFWLNPLDLTRNFRYNSKEIREIRKIIEDNYALIMEKWNEYFGSR